MIITDIPYREFAIPWVNDTCWADPKQLQKAVDHSRSRYQIIELLTNKDRVGLAIHVDVVAIFAASGQQTPVFVSENRLANLFVHHPCALLFVVMPKR